MKLAATLAVLVIWPSAALAHPAPLPPGVKASGRPAIAGLFIHGRSSGLCKGGGEFWIYQTGITAGVYATGTGCPEPSHSVEALTAARPFPEPPGSNPAFVKTCLEYPDCRTAKRDMVAGVPAACQLYNESSECVSMSRGPSRGLELTWRHAKVSGKAGASTKVDRVDEHAAIDPVVFEGVRREEPKPARSAADYSRWEQYLVPGR